MEGSKAHKSFIKWQRMYRRSSCFWYTRDTKVYSDLICVEEVYSDGENVSNCLFKCLSILSIYIDTRPHCWHIPHSLHISLHFSFPSLDTHTLKYLQICTWILDTLSVGCEPLLNRLLTKDSKMTNLNQGILSVSQEMWEVHIFALSHVLFQRYS